ncbi:hypothetical protein [Pseudothauera rhizosphaerae]|uniref:Uncharacterized protein n=1 Tax=Pseudothauera rhizosphaerae TaxID=2565932 RepID=A0A4S4AG28_9RHOO|nr:hypothetical protein [Pseudothauera rhizosphaerae]THF58108.1 hypothetical protein E6O51_17360 [Pseudothauera rhizosphaerae]
MSRSITNLMLPSPLNGRIDMPIIRINVLFEEDFIPLICQFRWVATWIISIFFILLLPFALYDCLEVSNSYDEPKSFSIGDSSIRVGGASRSPMTIAVRKDGKVVFLSSCQGLESRICRVSKYYSWRAVSEVGVLEISPQKGVIQYIKIDSDDVEKDVLHNRLAERYINEYKSEVYKKYINSFHVMVFSIFASFVYLLIKMLFPEEVKS